MAKLTIQAHSAIKVRDWIGNRGGIYVWRSVNLSNPGAEWITPATDEYGQPYTKPTWQAGNDPVHITNIADVDVITAMEVKRFHVATRMGSQGLSVKVTDGGSRRIRAAVAKAEETHGKPAWHEFDYGDYDNAVIMIEGERVPLCDYTG